MKKYLVIKSGKKDGNRLFNETIEELQKYRILGEDESKSRKKAILTKILPRIALYKIIQKEYPHLDAYSIVWEYTKTRICPAYAKRYRMMEHLPNYFKLFANTSLKVVGNSDKWDKELVPYNGDSFGFTIKKCLWYDTCCKCGCPELCKVFCDSDHEFYKKMKKTSFVRTQTIGTGGNFCDFIYLRRK